MKLRNILTVAAGCSAVAFYLTVFLHVTPDEASRCRCDLLAPLRGAAPR